MPYSYGGSSNAGYKGMPVPGYSYATLTSSMDFEDPSDAAAHRAQSVRRCSHSSSRVDRRHSRSPLHQSENRPASIYRGIGHGLTLPDSSTTRRSRRTNRGSSETRSRRSHSDRRISTSSSRPATHQNRTHDHNKAGKSRSGKTASRAKATKKNTAQIAVKTTRGESTNKSQAKGMYQIQPASESFLRGLIPQRMKKKSKSAISWGCFGS